MTARSSAGRRACARARRGELIEVAASETGKVFAEADVEVSEAVDFANYYAATARELDRVSGAVFVPAALTVVAPPWNFPVAIPAGGVLAALAAGSGVVFKPARRRGAARPSSPRPSGRRWMPRASSATSSPSSTSTRRSRVSS
jgi:delta 1-pyrroline-5-carboxylate dehydrogenase